MKSPGVMPLVLFDGSSDCSKACQMSESVLRAPLPVNTIQFEVACRGNRDDLITLSKRRADLLQALLASDRSVSARVEACERYYTSWRAFVNVLPRSTHTCDFLHFSWTHALFPSLETQTSHDTSVVYETVCAGLALIAVLFQAQDYTRAYEYLQQVQAAANRYPPRYSIPPARPGRLPFADLLQQAGHSVLGAVMQRPREPGIMAPSMHSAVHHVLIGFAAFTTARRLLRAKQTPKVACEHLFAAMEAMQRAVQSVPRCQDLRQSLCRANAYAYQVLSICVMQLDEIGVAIACAQEALAYAQAVGIGEAFQTRLNTLEQRNALEFAHQRVPDRQLLHIVFSEPSDTLQVRRALPAPDDDATAPVSITIVGLRLPEEVLEAYTPLQTSV